MRKTRKQNLIIISLICLLLLVFSILFVKSKNVVLGSTCGNGLCESGEDCQNCTIDCGKCTPTCGNGFCEKEENSANCPIDCAPTCGNGKCDQGENCQNCQIDCTPTCGNGACEYSCGENFSNCSIDCTPTCGNGVCEIGENCQNCKVDCGLPTCGNGVCESACGENPSNCCLDCYQSHYEKKCYDNDLYWYDCYGKKQEKAQECGDSGWTNEYRCSDKWVQRKWIEKGCSNSQCFVREEWRNYEYCSNYCSNGKCILPPTVITKGVVVTY